MGLDAKHKALMIGAVFVIVSHVLLVSFFILNLSFLYSSKIIRPQVGKLRYSSENLHGNLELT